MVLEYSLLGIVCMLLLVISLLIGFISTLGVYQKWVREKITSYECGFDPFGDARTKFDVHFYLVSIVFIIFDLEVVFLFPWALVLGSITWFGYSTMIFFIWILTIGFLVEWMKGGLDWNYE